MTAAILNHQCVYPYFIHTDSLLFTKVSHLIYINNFRFPIFLWSLSVYELNILLLLTEMLLMQVVVLACTSVRNMETGYLLCSPVLWDILLLFYHHICLFRKIIHCLLITIGAIFKKVLITNFSISRDSLDTCIYLICK